MKPEYDFIWVSRTARTAQELFADQLRKNAEAKNSFCEEIIDLVMGCVREDGTVDRSVLEYLLREYLIQPRRS